MAELVDYDYWMITAIAPYITSPHRIIRYGLNKRVDAKTEIKIRKALEKRWVKKLNEATEYASLSYELPLEVRKRKDGLWNLENEILTSEEISRRFVDIILKYGTDNLGFTLKGLNVRGML